MQRRDFIISAGRTMLGVAASRIPLVTAGVGRTVTTVVAGASEALYNGIIPPEPFPPILEQPWSTDLLPYYITDPPPVIRIDVGRQLFVDDFLIDSMVWLDRTFHVPTPYEGNPVFSPSDEDFHQWVNNDGYLIRTQLACPFSDGVWWDPVVRKFRAWYMGGPNTLRLAESTDGLNWTREGTGVVMSIPRERDSGTVWIDEVDPDPGRRYKMSFFAFEDKKNWLFTSADGVQWQNSDNPVARSVYYSSNPNTPTGDRSTFFYNPFRGKWVWSLRDIRDRREYGGLQFHRMRRYWEGIDLFDASAQLNQSGYWIEADSQDLEEAGEPNRPQLTIPQVYSVDAFPYESVMIFGLTILSSNAWENRSEGVAFPKRNEVYLGFSRDGFYMTRPTGADRSPFYSIGPPDSWNEGNVQTVGAGCVILGDPDSESLRFFYSGRRNTLSPDGSLFRQGHLGCASMRRDGFASLDAASRDGILTTRPIRFDHPDGYLFVNVENTQGSLRAEILDEHGVVIPGFDRTDCNPIAIDSTKQAVRWTDRESLVALSGKPFRLRFLLRSGRLFSFWIAPTKAGASEGFIAAGGPEYKAFRDASPPDTSSVRPELPEDEFGLEIAPNPVVGSFTLTYTQPRSGRVTITIHDAAGRLVRTLQDGVASYGLQTVRIEREGLSSGVYFCRVKAFGTTTTKKIVVL